MRAKIKTVSVILLFTWLVLCLMLASVGCADKENDLPSYTFAVGGADISIGDDINSISARVGEYNSLSRSPSCAGEGTDEMYVYSGYKIFAGRVGDVCRIVSIELTNDTRRTKEGIRIGDSISAVVGAYGDNYTLMGSRMIYRGKNATLHFLVKDGKVSSIKYLENDDQS